MHLRITDEAIQAHGQVYGLSDVSELELRVGRPGRGAALVIGLASGAIPAGICAWKSTWPVAAAVLVLATLMAFVGVRFLQPPIFRLFVVTKTGRFPIAADRDPASLQLIRDAVHAAQRQEPTAWAKEMIPMAAI
jgi:hypothetical protein